MHTVSFTCEFCGAKFPTFEAADTHERQCEQFSGQAQKAALLGVGAPPGLPPLGMQAMPGLQGITAMPGIPGVMGGMPQMMAIMAMMQGMGGDRNSSTMPGMIGGVHNMMGMPSLGSCGGGGGSVVGRGGDGQREPVDGKEPRVYKIAQEFIETWSLEKTFKMRLVQHLLKKDDHEAELRRLDAVLKEADVPPICRSGYLLVAFGEMNEKHTDEDFRAAILGKPLPCEMEGEKKEVSDEERDLCGDFRLGRCARGDRCRFSHGGGTSLGTKLARGSSLPESWMNDDIRDFAKQFNIDERLRVRMTAVMGKRSSTFKEDIRTLQDLLKNATHPPGMLSLQLREMENGTFQTRGWSDGQRDRNPRESGWKKEERERTKSRSRAADRKSDRSQSRSRRTTKSRSWSRKRKSRSRKRRRSSSHSGSKSASRSASKSRSTSRSRSRSKSKAKSKLKSKSKGDRS